MKNEVWNFLVDYLAYSRLTRRALFNLLSRQLQILLAKSLYRCAIPRHWYA
jgi:hypothetical protein